MPGCLRTIVPPATIPHTLEQHHRVPCDEVNVSPNGLLQELEDTSWMVRRHAPNDRAEVSGQIEHHTRLGLGFEKC